jgi:hypothetical protein
LKFIWWIEKGFLSLSKIKRIMKNIHVLPTEKPSKIHIVEGWDKLHLTQKELNQSEGSINQNISITSDEEIKEGDWVIALDTNIVFKCNKYEAEKPIKQFKGIYRKIILTTDQNLIKNGVQAIPDKFLEWFVKNPSCEFVKIEKNCNYGKCICYMGICKEYQKSYEIIIPREESKCFYDTPKFCENSECRVLNKCRGEFVSTKQETIEDAIEKIYGVGYDGLSSEERVMRACNIAGFFDGAKWQAEKMYSEEEVLDLIVGFVDSRLPSIRFIPFKDIREWFDKVKKK